ncbi:hypothetical protein ACA081_00245 [Candidatus Hodgkinia cicadicola]
MNNFKVWFSGNVDFSKSAIVWSLNYNCNHLALAWTLSFVSS